MRKFDIVPYEPKYREKLYAYLMKITPDISPAYLEYSINKSVGMIPSILVISDDNNIVGCHLFFNTSSRVKGTVMSVAWGHGTFLDKDYRSSAGIDFVLAINCNNTLGIGYSDINCKIQQKLKINVRMMSVYNYFLIDYFFIWGVLKKVMHSSSIKYIVSETIQTKVTFRLVNTVDDVVFPSDGFWFGDFVEFDLIRDSNYLEDRFINNMVYKYNVYEYHNDSGDSCYFVVRPILYRGIPAILLSDYRYNKRYLLDCIVQAVKKIARKNYIGLIQTTGGMREVEEAFNTVFCIKRLGVAMIHKSLKPNSYDQISITPADSDVDFNR